MELSYRNNPKSLFRKYAYLATWFANTPLGKDYLGFSRDTKIGLLLPNGYHQVSHNSGRAVFYPRLASWTPTFYKALFALDLVQNWVKDFNEAQQFLAWQLGLTRRIPALARALMFNTSTFNPDAHPEATSVDGWIQRNVWQDTWANERGGAGTSAGPSATSGVTYDYSLSVCTADTTNTFDRINRSIFLFDTSSLADDATLNSAIFSIYVLNHTYNFPSGTWSISLVDSAPASNIDLVSSDYGNVGATLQASTFAEASITNSQYNDITLNATGLGNVTKTGISKFGLRDEYDRANSAPPFTAYSTSAVNCYYADNGSNKPKLTVDFTLPIPPAANKLKFYRRTRTPGNIVEA